MVKIKNIFTNIGQPNIFTESKNEFFRQNLIAYLCKKLEEEYGR